MREIKIIIVLMLTGKLLFAQCENYYLPNASILKILLHCV